MVYTYTIRQRTIFSNIVVLIIILFKFHRLIMSHTIQYEYYIMHIIVYCILL